MNSEKVTDYWKDFHRVLSEAGIGAGDTVYVASDITKILVLARQELELASKEEQFKYLDMLIDALKEHVTESGTLLFPVYSWAFCKGEPFDYLKTQGEVGALNNYVLNSRKDFVRTFHPIYSFMVWGREQNKYLEMRNQDSWGASSPFAHMHNCGAKELDLSVSLKRSLTFKHYVEECVQVPYRHPKFFLSQYVDSNGVTEVKCFSMYVRDLSVKLESCQEIGYFIEKNCAVSREFHGWSLNTVDFSKAYKVMEEDLLHNNGCHLYQFEDYEIDWDNNDNLYEIGYWKDRNLI